MNLQLTKLVTALKLAYSTKKIRDRPHKLAKFEQTNDSPTIQLLLETFFKFNTIWQRKGSATIPTMDLRLQKQSSNPSGKELWSCWGSKIKQNHFLVSKVAYGEEVYFRLQDTCSLSHNNSIARKKRNHASFIVWEEKEFDQKQTKVCIKLKYIYD